MKPIDPHAIYDQSELRELLRGVVKIERLRRYGLVGSPGCGYWGRNIIDSLNEYWDHLARQRGTGKVKKESHLEEKPEVFENQDEQIQNQSIHPASGTDRPLESQRQRFRRKLSSNPL